MIRVRRAQWLWAGSIAMLAALALAASWIEQRRAQGFTLRSGRQFVVTSGADDGPGSLRNAIFAAARAEGRAQILLRTPRIALHSPLPPIINPDGVVLEAAAERVTIDGSGLPAGPLLELRARNSVVRRITLVGAASIGLLIRADGVQVRDIEASQCAEGVVVADGTANVLVENSSFHENGLGLVVAPGAERVTIAGNRFAAHDRAAVWAVAARPSASLERAALTVRDNTFEGDRISIVLIHFGARVERNRIRRAQEAGIYVTGKGAQLRENRSSEGAGVGIFADNTDRAIIEDNELDHNAALGIMLRGSAGTLVEANRLYRNGYGIVSVFGNGDQPNLLSNNVVIAQYIDGLYLVGTSPLVRGNRALQNGAAAVRVLDFVPRRGPTLDAEPRLQDNVFRENKVNGVVFGRYTERRPRSAAPR